MIENAIAPSVQTITSVVSIPAATQKTGTVSSSQTQVTGVGTAFRTDVLYPNLDIDKIQYPFIFNPSTGEIRKIIAVNSDTILQIDTAFSINLAAANFQVINWAANAYRSVSINAQSGTVKFCTVGATPQTLDNTVIENLERVGAWVQPIGLDCSAGQAQVTLGR